MKANIIQYLILQVISLAHILIKRIIIIFFFFTVIRNPYDRLVSLYNWGSEYHNNSTFEQFILNISKNYYKEFSGHRYKTQKEWISNDKGEIIVKNIIRFENINIDFNKILKKLNIPNFTIKNQNCRTRYEYLPTKHYSYYYNKTSINIVNKLYKDDLELFGYNFENIDNIDIDSINYNSNYCGNKIYKKM